MPSTLLGLLLFAVLLAPGLAFVVVRESRYPAGTHSAFRETTVAGITGVVCDVTTLVVFGLVRWQVPGHTPDLGRLLAQPASYIRGHLPYVAGWALAVLGFSVLLGVALGYYLPESVGRIRPISAWYKMFNGHGPDVTIYVGCELDGGSYVGGDLLSYSEEVKESADRDLVLTGDITYRPAGSAESVTYTDGRALIISARRISTLSVSYVTDP